MNHVMLVFEQAGVAVAAISGVLAAENKRVDLFGVVVLALVTALGGGTIRDVVLAAKPVFWIHTPAFVLNASVTAVVMFCIVRYWNVPARFLVAADAFALGLFTILGAAKALTAGVGGTAAVVLGVITGVAGGIIRDVLVREVPLVFRQQIYLYATAAVCGASVFVLGTTRWPQGSAWSFAGLLVILVLRFAAIRWRLTLPLYEHRPEAVENADAERR